MLPSLKSTGLGYWQMLVDLIRIDGEKKPLSRCMKKQSQFGTLPIHFLSIPLRSVAPAAILPVGVRTSFFQAVPPGLQLRPMTLGGEIVRDESRWLGTLFRVIPITLSVSRYCITCFSCAPWKSGNLIENFGGCRVCVTRKTPARWTQHTSQSHLSQRRSVAQHVLWGGTSPWALQNELCCFLSVPAQWPLVCFLAFNSCHAAKFFSFSHSSSTAAVASGVFIVWRIGIGLCTIFSWPVELYTFGNVIIMIFV